MTEGNLNIKTINQEIRDVLDKDLVNFNLAFFDPPYTPNAVRIWLIIALQALFRKREQ
jgi:16S rRNA G966 N2-methylase RsmD